MAAEVVVVGASNMDLISYVNRLPVCGETIHGSRFKTGCGGKGANQCVMAAKLGASAAMVTKMGADVFGHEMLRNYQAMGVCTEHAQLVEGVSTGVAPIAVDAEGNNSIIIVNGANDMLTCEDVDRAADTIGQSKVLVTQLEIRPEVTLQALRWANKKGVTSIFNPAPARSDLSLEFFILPDIFCCNEPEGEMLTGVAIVDEKTALRCGEALLDRGAKAVIITLGAAGSLLVQKKDPPVFIPVASHAVAVDTTGAGDAFLGALAFYLARAGTQLPLAEMVRRSCVIASVSVQKQGTQSSYPTREELPADLFAGL